MLIWLFFTLKWIDIFGLSTTISWVLFFIIFNVQFYFKLYYYFFFKNLVSHFAVWTTHKVEIRKSDIIAISYFYLVYLIGYQQSEKKLSFMQNSDRKKMLLIICEFFLNIINSFLNRFFSDQGQFWWHVKWDQTWKLR